MPESAIFGVRSNAGMALLSGPKGGTPCPSCLTSRLTDGGFEPHEPPGVVDGVCIPKSVAARLIRQSEGWAPVVLLRHGHATSHVLLPFPNCPVCASYQESLKVDTPPPTRARWIPAPVLG